MLIMLADELDSNVSDAQQTTEDAGEVAPVDEQKESTTPVTDYIEGVAKEIAPATDTSEDAEEEDFQYGSGAMVEEDEDDLSEIDQHLKNSSDALYELADGVEAEKAEVKENEDEANVEDELADDNKDETVNEKEVLGTVDVENANSAAEQAKQTAENSETQASTSANNADAAATKALNTATQEDIDAAKTALDTAKTDLKQAQEDAKAAEDAVQDAVDKLNAVLTENGLKVVTTKVDEETGEETEEVSYVSEDDLDDLLARLLDEDGKPVSEENFLSLKGAAREAIVEAYNAFISAQNDLTTAKGIASDAQETVNSIEDSYEYKIAVQKDIIDDDKATDDDKADAEKEIAKLSYEFSQKDTKIKVTSLVEKQDAKGNTYYEATYEYKDADKNVITNTVNIRVLVSEEGVSLSEVTVTDVPAHYEKAGELVEEKDGIEFKTVGGKTYAIDTDDESKQTLLKDEKVPEGATDIEIGDPTYTYDTYFIGYEEKKSDSYDGNYGNLKGNIERYFKEGAVRVEVKVKDKKTGEFVYDNSFYGSITQDDLKSIYHKGNVQYYAYKYVEDTKKPIYSESKAIIETVTTTYTVSETHEEKESFSLKKNKGKYSKEEYDRYVQGYINTYGKENVKVGQFDDKTKKYEVIITKTTTEEKTATTQTAYAAEELTYVDETTLYTDSLPHQIVTSSGIEQVKSDYTNATSAKDAADKEVKNATDKVADIRGIEATEEKEEVPGVLSKVIDAIKEVLKLTSVSGIADSRLTTIEGIVNTADANYNAAVAKKAANDAAAAAASAATTTTTGGGAPVVYPSATVAAATEEVDETVIPDDAVPAAGQTRTTRTRRTAANNAVAEEETTTIDEAETPLAGGDADDAVVEDTEDTTTVEEDLVPLAGEAQKGFFARTWWGWLLLIIAVLTGSTAYAKKKADAKKVK